MTDLQCNFDGDPAVDLDGDQFSNKDMTQKLLDGFCLGKKKKFTFISHQGTNV